MTYTQIINEARRIVKASATSLPDSEILASANNAMERETAIIRNSEGRWQWDDSNDTDFPFATTSLVINQQDYSLDPTHYRIERVELKDEAGSWKKLIPIDQADIYNQSLTGFLSSIAIPSYYDKVGNSLFLYPIPSYSQAASLKVFYERGPSYFLSTDTTKTPGFNPLFHKIIPYWIAYDYAVINDLPITKTLYQMTGNGDAVGLIPEMENNLKGYYLLRDKDEHLRLQSRVVSSR